MAFGAGELGLGVVNPRTDTVESVDVIVDAVQQALLFYPAERIFLNPDCGFGTFSARPVNSSENASSKMRSIVSAAEQLRARAAQVPGTTR